MNRLYILTACLACTFNSYAVGVCQDEILEAVQSGDSVKALLCLSERVGKLENNLDNSATQQGNTDAGVGPNYNPENPPFALRLNRSVLVCDNRFTIAYTGYDERRQKYVFKINGAKNKGRPGGQFFKRVRTSSNGLSQVTVRFLEYLKSEDAPVITYTCTDLR